MWEFVCGNTFGALAFTSYGGFWISFAVIFIPGFNIGNDADYVKNPLEFSHALGHYLICTGIHDGTNGRLVYIYHHHVNRNTANALGFIRSLLHVDLCFLDVGYFKLYRKRKRPNGRGCIWLDYCDIGLV